MFKIQWVSDFFELRRLRRDLRTADAVHLKQTDEISDLKRELSTRQSTIDAQVTNLKKVRADLTKTRKKIRDQTGADLLVNALRELGVMPKPEKYDAFGEANRLQEMANQQNRALGQQSQQGLSNLLGRSF